MIPVDKNITDNTCNHQCSRCGECCGIFIPFTEKELSIIKAYVKDNNILPENRLSGKDFKAKCCFYDETNKKCNIYSVRPYACRDFKCSHKDWKHRRDMYEKRAKYNSSKSKKTILASFDDLVYGNTKLFIEVVASMFDIDLRSWMGTAKLVLLLDEINRKDILKTMTFKSDTEDLDGLEYLKIVKESGDI